MFTASAVVLGGQVFIVKAFDQRNRDKSRKTYRLGFPSELSADRVNAWVRSISGTLRGSKTRLIGIPSITFEMWASDRGIVHRIKVPWQHADYVVSQLRSLVPGIRVMPEEEYPNEIWTRTVEVGLTNTSRQLRIFSPSDMSASLLAAVHPLESDEKMLVQWVISPAVPSHKPIYKTARSNEITPENIFNGRLANRDEVNDRRAKLEEPNMMGVLRVAATASTDTRAEHLIHRVRASLASSRGPSTRFVRRFVTAKARQRRIESSATPVIFPMQLSAAEVTSLIAWPIGNPFIAGLPPVMSRHLPASEVIPRTGRVIGLSNMPGNERPIAVSYEDARKHMHVVGPTGVGKTALLANMMKQDIDQGYGVVLIENKGDLFNTALHYVPKHRAQDVIILDVNDTAKPVGFNILNQGDPRVIVDELVGLFDRLYRSGGAGVWTREVLYHGLHTMIRHPELTFVDLAPLLVPMSVEEANWRDSIIRSAKDIELRNFWQRFLNQPRAAQDRITQPVMDRIWQLNARPELRRIIGQSTSSFQMFEVVRDNKILLVNLSGIGRETASLTGTMIMNALWHAVKTTGSNRPTYLYLDEFQDFMTLPVDPEDMLAKARGFGLGMVLAHQHLSQLGSEMQQAVMANARTKVVFQTSADDARAMSREFGNAVNDADFMHLGRYEAISRIATGDGVSAPVTLTTVEPARGHGLSKQIRRASQDAYGRPANQVVEEIHNRRTTVKKQQGNKKPPKIGGGWG